MNNLLRLITLLVLFSGAAAPAVGFDLGSLSNNGGFLPVREAYRVAVVVEPETVHLDWTIAPEYYLYRDKFQITVKDGASSKTLPAKVEAGIVKFDEYEGKDVGMFYDATRVSVALGNLSNEFTLSVRSQGCADAGLCYAPDTRSFDINRTFGTAVEVAASTGGSSATGATESGDATATSLGTYGMYMLFALIGGMILNLMPCVFPVLSLKALSFASSNDDAHHHHLHGWAYTLGVVGSFIVAAVVILAAKAAGEQSGWGFQLQSPTFIAFMAYLFLVMGLSLSLIHI